jgi:hypothetical protein
MEFLISWPTKNELEKQNHLCFDKNLFNCNQNTAIKKIDGVLSGAFETTQFDI